MKEVSQERSQTNPAIMAVHRVSMNIPEGVHGEIILLIV